MKKKYTAQEMRDMANCLHYNSPTKLTIEAAAMLRQAADAMEREERERKYEYAVRNLDGVVIDIHKDTKIRAIDCKIEKKETVVRREVGEWEEVNE